MSAPQIPPNTEPMVDKDQNVTLPWQAYFESTSEGDPGNVWTPTFQGLTSTGPAPTFNGTYYYLSQNLAYFHIVVTPGSGGTTSAVAGTTYCDNFPLNLAIDGVAATIGGAGAAVGAIASQNKQIYTATWTSATGNITIVGIVELQ